MRWSKENKKLIKEIIELHQNTLKSGKLKRFFNGAFCPFCKTYQRVSPEFAHICEGCPNDILAKRLGLLGRVSPCYKMAKWQGILVADEGYGEQILKTEANIKKRIEFWEDSLVLSFQEFKKKWERSKG